MVISSFSPFNVVCLIRAVSSPKFSARPVIRVALSSLIKAYLIEEEPQLRTKVGLVGLMFRYFCHQKLWLGWRSYSILRFYFVSGDSPSIITGCIKKPAISLLAYAKQLTYTNHDIADFYCSWAETDLKYVKVYSYLFSEICYCKLWETLTFRVFKG